MEKITKREMFEAIKETFETGTCKFDAATVMAFCDKEIASLDSKAAKAKERAAAKRAEGDELTDAVQNALTDEFQTIADIITVVAEADPEVSAAKITARLTKLVKANVVEKEQVTVTDGDKKKKAMAYRLASIDVVAEDEE
jgi:hypothetical protein